MPFWVLKTVFLKKLALDIKLVLKENKENTTVSLKQMSNSFHLHRLASIVWEKTIM